MSKRSWRVVSRASKALPALTLAAFWLPLLGPLAQRGMMTCSHDGMLHFLRAFQLDTLVRQGVLWPRWLPGMAFGYGYPLFNFYPALSLYPILILHRLGLSLLQGWNATLAMSILASGLTMYWWARQVVGQRGGFVAAVAYMLAPYQLYDVYWRGSLAESLALPLMPVVLWAALSCATAQEHRWRYTVIGTLAYAAILLTHVATSLMFTLVLPIYLLVLIWSACNRRAVALQLAGILVLGWGLAAFFWAPAFLEKNQVQLWRAIASSSADYHYHFLTLAELVKPAQASDPLLVNPSPPRSLGWVTGLLAAIGVLATAWNRGRVGKVHKVHVVWASLSSIAVIALMLPISEHFWSRTPLLPFIQFPWRFLGVSGLLISLLAGAAVAALDGDGRLASGGSRYHNVGHVALPGFCAVVLAIGAWPWAYPRLCPASDNPTQASYVAYEESTGLVGMTASGEYLPAAVQELATTSPLVEAIRAGQPVNRWDAPGARVLQARDDGLSAELVLESDAPISVTYRAFYFPGWNATLDGQSVPLKVVPPLGLMTADVPAGRHTVVIQFGSTPLRTASELVSAIVVLVVIAICILDLRTTFHTPRSPVVALLGQPVRPATWLWLIALGLALLAFKLGVIDRYDTPLRWRRLRQDGQFKGATYTSDAVIAERARLLGYDVHPQPTVAGDVVDVDLYWTFQQKLNFRAAVRLLDERGLEWSAKNELEMPRGAYSPPPPSREWPPGTYADDRHTIQVLPGTPPGDYVLVALPFHPDTLEPLSVSAGTPAPGNYPGVVLGKLRVTSPAHPLPPDALDLTRTDTPMGADLTLIGYNQDRGEAAPGQAMLLTLGWRARRQPQADYVLRLELVAPDGQVVTALSLPPGGDHYPTLRWAAGEVVRTQTLAHIPGRATSGQHIWRATLLDNSGTPVGQAMLGQLQIIAPERTFDLPPVGRRIDAQLGDWVALVGVNAPDNVAPGQAISITLVWQALGETNQDYKTFVHLLSADGQLVTQSDAVPAGWTRPTSGWQPGEFVQDSHTLAPKRNLSPGEYHLLAGMYDGDGRRLPPVAGGDTVELGTIQVK